MFSLFGCTTKIYFMSSLFLSYINNVSNHTVSTVKQLVADSILFSIAHNAKTSADELNSDLKANMKGHPYVIQSRSNPDLY